MKPEWITSRQNNLLSRAVKLQSSRRFRQEQQAYVGDGIKLLEEALRWTPSQLETVILQEDMSCPELPEHVRHVRIPRTLMQQVSGMEAPEGALFVMKMPEERPAEVRPGVLVLDGIQDPGNVGTILRTADAMDVPALLTDGCADPYNAKTVRAAMGAIFRTPPVKINREKLIEQCRTKNIPILAAALSDEARDLRRENLRGAVTVIGSEGQGVSQQLLDASDGQIIIPMSPRCESLNAAAAAAIVLWQMTAL